MLDDSDYADLSMVWTCQFVCDDGSVCGHTMCRRCRRTSLTQGIRADSCFCGSHEPTPEVFDESYGRPPWVEPRPSRQDAPPLPPPVDDREREQVSALGSAIGSALKGALESHSETTNALLSKLVDRGSGDPVDKNRSVLRYNTTQKVPEGSVKSLDRLKHWFCEFDRFTKHVTGGREMLMSEKVHLLVSAWPESITPCLLYTSPSPRD